MDNINNWSYFVELYKPRYEFLGMGIPTRDENRYCINGDEIAYPRLLNIAPNARVFKAAIAEHLETVKGACVVVPEGKVYQ